MDALELLKHQHREIRKLFEAFTKATPDEAWGLFEYLAGAILLHVDLEERRLFPAARDPGTETTLRAAYADHEAARRIIATVRVTGPDAKSFRGQVRDLIEHFKVHLREEEEDLFPKIKRLIPRSDRERMAAEMEQAVSPPIP